MGDPLARPGQQGSPGYSGLPAGPSLEIGTGGSTTPTTLPGTAGINLATGSVKAFGLEDNSNQPGLFNIGISGEANTFKVAEPWRSIVQNVQSHPYIATRFVEPIEGVGQLIGQIPVVSNVVGLAGNPIGTVGDVVGSVLGGLMKAGQAIYDEGNKLLVAGPRVSEAMRIADLATGKNLADRKAEYDRLRNSPLPWDWSSPARIYSWSDYLNYAKNAYNQIGTEQGFQLNKPSTWFEITNSLAIPFGQLAGGGAGITMTNLSFLSSDFKDLYNKGVPAGEILNHLEATGKLTNSDPVNALVVSLINPIAWKGYDLPFKAAGIATRTSVGTARTLGEIAKISADNAQFAENLAKVQMSKPAYNMFKNTRMLGVAWNQAEKVGGDLKAAVQFWTPTAYQAVAEELGTTNIFDKNQRGTAVIQRYHDIHASVGEAAADSFNAGIARTIQHEMTQATYMQYASEARASGLANSEEVLQLAAKGDLEALSSHPLLNQQNPEIIKELSTVGKAFAANPAGEAEIKAMDAVWRKLLDSVVEAKTLDMKRNLLATGKEIKRIFKSQKDKILAGTRATVAKSAARHYTQAAEDLTRGIAASGRLFETTVNRHIAAAGISGSSEAEAVIRAGVQGEFSRIQELFNASSGVKAMDKANFARELANHAEIALMAAFGKALDLGIDLNRLRPGVNIISNRSLTQKVLDQLISDLNAAIKSGSTDEISRLSLRAVKDYDQVGSRLDGAGVFEQFLKETPDKIGAKVLSVLRQLREGGGYVTEDKSAIRQYEILLNGADAMPNPDAVIPPQVWDISPELSAHKPFDGEIDATPFVNAITGGDQKKLLLIDTKAAHFFHLDMKQFLLKNGVAWARAMYEKVHDGVLSIVRGNAYATPQISSHARAGLRPMVAMSEAPAHNSRLVGTQENFMGLFGKTSEINPADSAFIKVPWDHKSTANVESILIEQGTFDKANSWVEWWKNTLHPEKAWQKSILSHTARDGYIKDSLGRMHLVKNFTGYEGELHSMMVRNRIMRQMSADVAHNSIWAHNEVRVAWQNPHAQLAAFEAAGDMENAYTLYAFEESVLHSPDAFNYAQSASAADKSKTFTGALTGGGSIYPSRILRGTASNIEELTHDSHKLFFLDPHEVIGKYLVRADQWADKGVDFTSSLLHINPDGKLVKVVEEMNPNFHLPKGTTIDPNLSFKDWFSNNYLNTALPGTKKTVLDFLKDSYGRAQFDATLAKYREAYPNTFTGNDGWDSFMVMLMQDSALSADWAAAPRAIVQGKKIASVNAAVSNAFFPMDQFEGFSHSWADWLHAWDSSLGEVYNNNPMLNIAALDDKNPMTFFDAFGNSEADIALWRLADQMSVGHTIPVGQLDKLPFKNNESSDAIIERLALKYADNWRPGLNISDLIPVDNSKAFLEELSSTLRDSWIDPSQPLANWVPLATTKAMLHNQAEMIGSIADRGFTSAIADIGGAETGMFTANKDSLFAYLNNFGTYSRDPEVIAQNPVEELIKAQQQSPDGFYTLTPRVYAENGMPLAAPKIVNSKNISSARTVPTTASYDFMKAAAANGSGVAHSYGYNLPEEYQAIGSRAEEVMTVDNAAEVEARKLKSKYDELASNESFVKQSELYKQIKELGYSIGKNPSNGLLYETIYIPSIIDKEIVPVVVPRPFIPITERIPFDTLGIKNVDRMIANGEKTMNFAKRAMVNWANNELYVSTVNRLWAGSNGKLSETEAYSIMAHLQQAAIKSELGNAAGLTSEQIADIFVRGMGGGEYARRKFMNIFGVGEGKQSARALVLYAVAGDLGKVGLAPNVSKSIQARFPALASWAQKMFPNMRYRYSPFFNQQEAIEPIALLELNGIRGDQIRSEASLLTGALSAPGTTRWDNYEVGSQILRVHEAGLAEIAKNAEGLDLWGQMRANKTIGSVSKFLAPIGDTVRQQIAASKAVAIQLMAYNNAKVRGGFQRVVDAIPEVKQFLSEVGLNSTDAKFKYMLDAAAVQGLSTPVLRWGKALAAKWTPGVTMDLAPLQEVRGILAKLQADEPIALSDLDSIVSARLIAEHTGATEGAQKQFVTAVEDMISSLRQTNSGEVKTVAGDWRGNPAMTTANGITDDIRAAIRKYTGTFHETVNTYLPAKAEYGVQETALARNQAKMEQIAERKFSQEPGGLSPVEQMDKVIANIDKAINSNVIIQNYPLYRGADLADFVDAARIGKLKVGDEFGMENISSWSRDIFESSKFTNSKEPVMLQVINPRGMPGIDLLAQQSMTGIASEAEVLLPRGLKWRVVGVGRANRDVFKNLGSSVDVPMLTISPVLPRNFRTATTGPAAGLASIQGVQQALDTLFVEYSKRAETAKWSYKLFEKYPVLKKALADRGIELNRTYREVANIQDVLSNNKRTWQFSYNAPDPTTGAIERKSMEFLQDPGQSSLPDSVAFGVPKSMPTGESLGMNSGGKTGLYTGTDGVDRFLKLAGQEAPDVSEKELATINEWVGQITYRKLGRHVPKTALVRSGKDLYLASDWLQDVTKKPLKDWTQEEARRLSDGILLDHVFGSFDVTGRLQDVTSMVDNAGVDAAGNAYRIDLGSFGLFRAGGQRKNLADIGQFNPVFFLESGARGSRWGMGQMLKKAWPDSLMATEKTKSIINHPHFLELADELFTKLDSIHPDGLKGYFTDMFTEGWKASGEKVAHSDVVKTAEDTAKLVEVQLAGLRDAAEVERASRAAQVEAYQAAKAAGESLPKSPESTWTPDPVVEDLLAQMAYHRETGNVMFPAWDGALTKIANGENLTSQELDTLMTHLPEWLYRRVEYDRVFKAMTIALMEGTQKAVVRQLYPTEKTWLERSFNHPYLGIYPLSYQIHKVLPEFIDALLKYAPFEGSYKPLWGAYQLQQINDHIAAALETNNDLKKYVESKPPLLLWLNGILPGFPTDVSVSLPYWLRAGILAPLSQGKPQDIVPSLERAGLTTMARSVGPLQSAQQIYNIQNDIWDFIFGQNNNPFGGIGDAIQNVFYQGDNANNQDIINRP